MADSFTGSKAGAQGKRRALPPGFRLYASLRPELRRDGSESNVRTTTLVAVFHRQPHAKQDEKPAGHAIERALNQRSNEPATRRRARARDEGEPEHALNRMDRGQQQAEAH